MSRTKRAYNKPSWNGWARLVHHPYGVWCMGNCSLCKTGKDRVKNRRERRRKTSLLRLELEEWN